MKKIVKWFLLAQLLDLLTTLVGILYFGAQEGNPIMIRFGLVGLIAFKLIAMIIVADILLIRFRQAGRLGIKVAIFLTVFSFLAPTWNTFVIILTLITGNGVI